MLLVAIVAVVVFVAIAKAEDPERPMNDCADPIKWTKAEGEYDVYGAYGALSGRFTRIDASTKDSPYGGSGFHAPSVSFLGKKGAAWVTSYAVGPDGIVTDLRDSERIHYDFALLFNDIGAAHGTFRTGEVCVESHGTLTWYFTLKTQDEGSNQIFTLTSDQRVVNI